MCVRQTTSGNWYVQYRIPYVKSPKKEYFGKDEQAMQNAIARENEIQHGYIFTVNALHGNRAIYLDELGQCYLDSLRLKNKNQGWRCTLKHLLNEHFLPVMCHAPVDQLTIQDAMRIATRFESKSPATINRYMDSLHAIFRFGIQHELTVNDPMRHWKKQREPKRGMRLTLQDLGKIYAAASDHLKWILEVEWELGTRPGCSELFSLRWSDVDFSNGCIRIRGTKTISSDRVIPLTPYFKERLFEKHKRAESQYIIEKHGRGIKQCRKSFATAIEKAGIEYHVRLYDIRHLFASTMLAKGGDLKAVSKLLGHSSTRMTADTYYHELQGEKERALSVKPSIII